MIRTWTPESDAPTPEQEKVLEIRTWLGICRQKTQAVEDQRDKIRRLRESAARTTPGMNGLPGGSGSGDRVGGSVARISEAEDRLLEMEQDLSRQKAEAYRRILWPLGNEPFYTSKMVDYLEGYYLDCRSTDRNRNFQLVTYEQLAGRKNVEVSSVKKSIRKAVRILARYWDSF